MGKQLAYYSGTIEAHKDGCYVGGQKIDCPKEGQSLFERPFLQSGVYEPGSSALDVLPQNPALDVRNDFLFITIFLVVAAGLLSAAIFRVKIFGMTLAEYLKPIWYFVLVSVAVVFWQYLVGINLEGASLELRISQWVWEAMVLVSAYKLSRSRVFGYANAFFLGVLYTIFIHGLKVSIRYFFYAKTIWYALDRFLYGGLLVMAIAFILGSVFVYLRKRKGVVIPNFH
ncbi:hypothetical protein COU12_00050 [Candidatus Jorgensenbacteria bacterium CG10_big_fil_rev_8_21_14_0_10_54_38]|uniref:Uncharacterized protein n=2 Tax=Candidatus Joergenseniibacteriota TaxID=1752739 RepID=A0A2M6WGT6_9BACT|nr:MAG: hypothetical protein COX26_02260 [Candidatus Jorgensenbacteria bacterium CG23_combo_of_CG06-09_8_20_14_all_54_14]PIT91987.1 MAG: hypothetical protein COU12_00050 [Candidatus Jorgensenbacteria bacterium CG10_big_fil_rev_8_21_14_0_10_54_38]